MKLEQTIPKEDDQFDGRKVDVIVCTRLMSRSIEIAEELIKLRHPSSDFCIELEFLTILMMLRRKCGQQKWNFLIYILDVLKSAGS